MKAISCGWSRFGAANEQSVKSGSVFGAQVCYARVVKTPKSMGYPLELSACELQERLDEVLPYLTEFLDSLSVAPADLAANASPQMLSQLREALPEEGVAFGDALEILFRKALPDSLNAASPGFMGYVPGGGILYAALADLIANSVNRFVGAAPVAPGFSQIETTVVNWFCEIIGLPGSAKGFMTSGGSMANQSALATARTVQCGEQFDRAVIYLSDQAHNCLAKAAYLCGFARHQVKILPSDDQFRLSVGALESAIKADRAAGLQPMFLAASAGTTNTGSIDPLEALAEVCRREKLWFHVDAAYGGFFCLTERGRQRLQGIERADSVALDPHKTLFLPYGTGALLVRDGKHLVRTFAASADYLPDALDDEGVMDFRELSPELTRPFRGLRVWLPMKVHGAETFAAYLDEKLNLAAYLHTALLALDGIDVLAPPELSILAFAVSSGEHEVATRNARSQQLMARVNEINRVHLSGTMLGDVFAVRVAIGVFRTHQIHIDSLLEDIQVALNELTH